MKFRDRNEWALYIDHNNPQGVREYRPILTTDPFNVSSYRLQDAVGYDMGGTPKRHGAITPLTTAEESRVLARWPNTPAQRLQSFNFQDRYVRHTNLDVRIDPGVSPAEDARFRLRPGLTGTATVSFESVNMPGYFLRHFNYDFQLVRNDGSSQFAQDATFRKTAGLADSSWSSFQSYNHPDRYIRHYAYQLRLDPITNATGRSDATFRAGVPGRAPPYASKSRSSLQKRAAPRSGRYAGSGPCGPHARPATGPATPFPHALSRRPASILVLHSGPGHMPTGRLTLRFHRSGVRSLHRPTRSTHRPRSPFDATPSRPFAHLGVTDERNAPPVTPAVPRHGRGRATVHDRRADHR